LKPFCLREPTPATELSVQLDLELGTRELSTLPREGAFTPKTFWHP